MTSFFNFRDECNYDKFKNYLFLKGRNKYDQEIYEIFMDSFDYLPLAALINGNFLCLHGGISPELKSIVDITRLDRVKEPPR